MLYPNSCMLPLDTPCVEISKRIERCLSIRDPFFPTKPLEWCSAWHVLHRQYIRSKKFYAPSALRLSFIMDIGLMWGETFASGICNPNSSRTGFILDGCWMLLMSLEGLGSVRPIMDLISDTVCRKFIFRRFSGIFAIPAKYRARECVNSWSMDC